MLLDEPTNHLDVKNVAWLEDYLTHLPDVTSMVVSHDSGFLDHVCTGIIHYENRKLKHYKVHTSSVAPFRCALLPSSYLLRKPLHVCTFVVYVPSHCYRLYLPVILYVIMPDIRFSRAAHTSTLIQAIL